MNTHASPASAAATAGRPEAAAAAVDQLSAALNVVGDALVAVDADALLNGEVALAAALSALSDIRSASDRDAAIAACGRTRVALLRCRRLGISFASLARAWSGSAASDSYDRAGAYVDGRGVTAMLQARA